jgi:hypothetical protein
VSKEIAMSMFNKLFTDIEYFYCQMQNIGIETTEEIVDAMECPTEERNIRMTFFNKVLLAKREYKTAMEQYKGKRRETTGADPKIIPKSAPSPPPSNQTPHEN